MEVLMRQVSRWALSTIWVLSWWRLGHHGSGCIACLIRSLLHSNLYTTLMRDGSFDVPICSLILDAVLLWHRATSCLVSLRILSLLVDVIKGYLCFRLHAFVHDWSRICLIFLGQLRFSYFISDVQINISSWLAISGYNLIILKSFGEILRHFQLINRVLLRLSNALLIASIFLKHRVSIRADPNIRASFDDIHRFLGYINLRYVFWWVGVESRGNIWSKLSDIAMTLVVAVCEIIMNHRALIVYFVGCNWGLIVLESMTHYFHGCFVLLRLFSRCKLVPLNWDSIIFVAYNLHWLGLWFDFDLLEHSWPFVHFISFEDIVSDIFLGATGSSYLHSLKLKALGLNIFSHLLLMGWHIGQCISS